MDTDTWELSADLAGGGPCLPVVDAMEECLKDGEAVSLRFVEILLNS